MMWISFTFDNYGPTDTISPMNRLADLRDSGVATQAAWDEVGDDQKFCDYAANRS